MTQADATTIKEQQKKEWGNAAEAWRKHHQQLKEVSAPITRAMLDAAGISPGHRVLDIACGSGIPAIPAAQAVGSAGFVLATDQAPEMIEVARENARNEGVTNIDFRLVDGEELEVEPNSFDAVTCRFGIMFMPEPVTFLRRAYEALKPNGRIAVAVWGPPQNNPFISLPMVIMRKYYAGPPLPDPTAPGNVFSFADKTRLQFVFEQAAFRDIHIDEMNLPMAVFDGGREFWDYCREIVGPLRRILDEMPPDIQDKISQEVIEAAPQGNPDSRVSLNGNPTLASATK
jgi:2-polyprenyl-3-methyl-5-hydroxy-6-metoxy-1,4-benzoquinol methylase